MFEGELQARVQEQKNLEAQLELLESRMLCGGNNIIDHTNDQQRQIQERRAQLAETKRREREMAQKLEKVFAR